AQVGAAELGLVAGRPEEGGGPDPGPRLAAVEHPRLVRRQLGRDASGVDGGWGCPYHFLPTIIVCPPPFSQTISPRLELPSPWAGRLRPDIPLRPGYLGQPGGAGWPGGARPNRLPGVRVQ